MRSAAIGFAILAYALALVQPFLPHVAFYVQRDALAELFCVNPQTSCNGSCYLMSKVRENGPETPARRLILRSSPRCPTAHGVASISRRPDFPADR
jgi:hypothetical protein